MQTSMTTRGPRPVSSGGVVGGSAAARDVPPPAVRPRAAEVSASAAMGEQTFRRVEDEYRAHRLSGSFDQADAWFRVVEGVRLGDVVEVLTGGDGRSPDQWKAGVVVAFVVSDVGERDAEGGARHLAPGRRVGLRVRYWVEHRASWSGEEFTLAPFRTFRVLSPQFRRHAETLPGYPRHVSDAVRSEAVLFAAAAGGAGL